MTKTCVMACKLLSNSTRADKSQKGIFMGELRVVNQREQSVEILFSEDEIIVASPPKTDSTASVAGGNQIVPPAATAIDTQAKSLASDPSGALGTPPMSRFGETPQPKFSIDTIEQKLKTRMLGIFETTLKGSRCSFEVNIEYDNGKPTKIKVNSQDLTAEQRMLVANNIRSVILRTPIDDNAPNITCWEISG